MIFTGHITKPTASKH